MGASDCELARTLIAVSVDHEATDLELARLRRHLHGCTECAALRDDHEALARAVRSSSRERPTRHPLPVHRRWRRVIVAAVLAVAIAGVIWLLTVVG